MATDKQHAQLWVPNLQPGTIVCHRLVRCIHGLATEFLIAYAKDAVAGKPWDDSRLPLTLVLDVADPAKGDIPIGIVTQ